MAPFSSHIPTYTRFCPQMLTVLLLFLKCIIHVPACVVYMLLYKVYTNEIIPNTLFCIFVSFKNYHGVLAVPTHTDLSHCF